jgi:hypothetical protein
MNTFYAYGDKEWVDEMLKKYGSYFEIPNYEFQRRAVTKVQAKEFVQKYIERDLKQETL